MTFGFAGTPLSRREHKWVDYGLHVDFVCERRAGRLKAVATKVTKDHEVATPNKWNSADVVAWLSSAIPKVTVLTTQPNLTQYDTDVMLLEQGDCFKVQWDTTIRKQHGSFTYQVAPGPKSAPNALDHDMNDRLDGSVEICCCAWQPDIPVLSEDDRRLDEEASAINEVGEGKLEELLRHYKIDWIATPGSIASGREAWTKWKGTYESKQCTYSYVRARDSEGNARTRLVKNGDYDSKDEAKDADDVVINDP